MSQSPSLSPLVHVLSIEGSRPDGEFTRSALRDCGYSVEVVETPGQCLGRLIQGSYMALVINHEPPRLDGTKLVLSLHDLEVEVPPIVFVSGFHDPDLLVGAPGVELFVTQEPLEGYPARLAKALEEASRKND